MEKLSSLAATARNSGLYPVGRFLRNTAAPFAGQTLSSAAAATRNSVIYPTGRYIRNTAGPYVGQKASNAVVYGIPAVGKTLSNYVIKPCVGRLCTMRKRRQNKANAAAKAVANAAANAAAKAAKANANNRTRRAATDGDINFTPGLEITDADRAILETILGIHNVTTIAAAKKAIADKVSILVSNYALDHNEELAAADYKRLAQGEFSNMAKGLYMIHMGSMGRQAELPESVPAFLAANILAQAHKIPSDEMVYDNEVSTNEELNAKIAEYNTAYANSETFGGYRKKSRKTRRSKTRRSRRKY